MVTQTWNLSTLMILLKIELFLANPISNLPLVSSNRAKLAALRRNSNLIRVLNSSFSSMLGRATLVNHSCGLL